MKFRSLLDCVRDAVGDAERIRLLNESIRAVSAVIAAPGVLPERLDVIPKAESSLTDWEFLIVQKYAECAILRKQCSTALVNRNPY